jgi:hypothetical protein
MIDELEAAWPALRDCFESWGAENICRIKLENMRSNASCNQPSSFSTPAISGRATPIAARSGRVTPLASSFTSCTTVPNTDNDGDNSSSDGDESDDSAFEKNTCDLEAASRRHADLKQALANIKQAQVALPKKTRTNLPKAAAAGQSIPETQPEITLAEPVILGKRNKPSSKKKEMEALEEVQTKKRRTRKEKKAGKAAVTESQNTAVDLLRDEFSRDGVDIDESDEERKAPAKPKKVQVIYEGKKIWIDRPE